MVNPATRRVEAATVHNHQGASRSPPMTPIISQTMTWTTVPKMPSRAVVWRATSRERWGVFGGAVTGAKISRPKEVSRERNEVVCPEWVLFVFSMAPASPRRMGWRIARSGSPVDESCTSRDAKD